MPSNIEKFDLLTAKILADLYARFPVRATITASRYGVAPEDGLRSDGSWDAGILGELDFFCDTVRWLGQSGYLDFSSELDGGVFEGGVLTAKGLEILKAMPASLSPAQPLGDYLLDSVRAGATDALKKGVAAALSAGATIAWHSLTR
ncbi:hypothetical protein PQR33_40485 [Paraburkholderia sediminicola]|uniref:hypothetical protein n=1 Tax=Paraburkholderia sediminicola TaxID=458836 RepID=UPI0038B7B0A1